MPPRARPLSRRPRRRRMPFGARLALALALSLCASGALSYVLLERRLERDAVGSEAQVVRADARTFEAIGRHAGDRAAMLGEIGDILQAVRARPGVREA